MAATLRKEKMNGSLEALQRKARQGRGTKGKGTWIVEFRLRGHYVKQAIPEARTRAEAEQAQMKLKRDIFDDKYNRASGNKDFTEFVDEVFVP
ncbi:MAG TPA: hypothetical protein VHH35_20740 [Pyrinomonadaceae bacterium]|nr:hypothetical protein [Pyrinomonadaceae bacterium]